MSRPALTLRPATSSDLPELIAVFDSAFHDSTLNRHCFPPSSPESLTANVSNIENNLHSIVVAQESSPSGDNNNPSGKILGWVRWERRLEPKPHITLTKDSYPPEGDQDLARRFFQANVDVTARTVGDQPHWFLSLLVVRREEAGKGVGSALMRYGTEKADEDGWMCYLNSSADGKPLYEKFGFRTVEVSEFEHGLATWHMKRDATAKN